MEERLRKFTKLVDAGSFTRAAAALHMSQPALTAAIKKLERELRAELLKRGAHHLQVTPAGELAYIAGQNMAAQGANLRQALAALHAQRMPFALGMIDSLADMLFVRGHELDALEQWAAVSLSINNSGLLTTGVLHHQLDAAIVVRQANATNLLKTTKLGVEPLVLVARTDVARATNRTARIGNVPNFLSYNQGSTTEQLVQAAAAASAVALTPSFYSTSPEIMLQLVLAGQGTAALPYLMIEKELQAGQLTPVFLGKRPVVERPIASIQLAARELPEAFSETLQRIATGLARIKAEAMRL